MPIYEYRCSRCRRKTSTLVRSFAPPTSITCSFCGSQETQKVMSTFSTIKSEDTRLEDMASDPEWSNVDEKDPKSMARWMHRMEHAMGQDLGGDLDELAEEIEAGAEPDDIETGEEDGNDESDGDEEEAIQ